MLSRYGHLSLTHLLKAVEGLTQAGTVTKTVADDMVPNKETQNLLKKVIDLARFNGSRSFVRSG